MPWKIRLVEPDKPEKEIGDAWYIPEQQIKDGSDGRRHWYGDILSHDYENTKRNLRQPIAVVLPSSFGGIFHCVDSDATNGTGGWQVIGDLPNLTVKPSLNLYGIYHGFITNGVISDDCEGRRFEADR